MKRLVIMLAGAAMLSGCVNLAEDGRDAIPTTTSLAFYPKKTQTQLELEGIPPPDRPVAVTVYNFSDETGQFKPSEQGQTLSRAVSQGSTSMLIKALEETETMRGGLYIPDTAKEKPQQGEVVAAGPGKFDEKGGTRIPMDVKVGDKVLYGKYSGTEVTIDGEQLLILRESDVLAIVG